jgi:hypothetical protein
VGIGSALYIVQSAFDRPAMAKTKAKSDKGRIK